MAIKTNIVGIEIDDKVYKVRKMAFGTQRKMIELQRSVSQSRKQLFEKYGEEDKIPEEESLELTLMSFDILDLLAEQFVDPQEGKIVEQLDQESVVEFIKALQ